MRAWAYVLGIGTLVAGGGMVMNSFGDRAEARAGERIAARAAPAPAAPAAIRTAHDITLTRIDGRPMPLAEFRGQVMLVVNTASMCGLTPQYEGLQKLQQTYAARGFTVVGIPSGDFGGQEYGSNTEIRQFCETRFGVSFPLTERSKVTGEGANPFHRWARATLAENNEPKWNFHKFLVGKDGRLIAGFGSRTDPTGPEITRAIERALAS
jgi:glutathione peroxidase